MPLWNIKVRLGNQYASARVIFRKGEEATESKRCPVCSRRIDQNVTPTIVEWDDGADEIADFIHGGLTVLVRDSVVDELIQQFDGIGKRGIIFNDHPSLYRPTRITSRMKKRVWLPYEGPPICEPLFLPQIEFHPRSTVSLDSRCDTCGHTVYKEFRGIERFAGLKHTPREPGKGFFFRKSDVREVDFFTPKHTGYRICTDRAKDYILNRGFNNVQFLEVGDLLDE